MKTSFYFKILLFIFLSSCNKKNLEKKFVLKGVLKGEIPEYIYLHYGEIKDTARIENGQFQFKGTVDGPIRSNLVIPNHSTMVDDNFYLENSVIKMEVSVEKKKIKSYEINFIKIDTIQGSKTEIIKNDFKMFEKAHKGDLDWNSKLFKKLEAILTKYPKNRYSADLFQNQIKKNIFSKGQVRTLFSKIDTLIISRRQLEDIRRILDPQRILEVGDNLYDFSLPGVNNKLIDTKNFRGKVLLIEFWAYWCVPCRKITPELLEVYDEFRNSNFEILGVSLDHDKQKWKQAILKDKITWGNVVAIEAFESKVAIDYGIYSLPNNYLLDKNGTIVAKNISVDDLRGFLKEKL
ncbi:MAG: AhpC/TSA family protein [Flavobacteriaceae bacterium]|nr:AhpC/TSA family protein [Flavobacteriaceae bacterium]